jgi:hypothetical protein
MVVMVIWHAVHKCATKNRRRPQRGSTAVSGVLYLSSIHTHTPTPRHTHLCSRSRTSRRASSRPCPPRGQQTKETAPPGPVVRAPSTTSRRATHQRCTTPRGATTQRHGTSALKTCPPPFPPHTCMCLGAARHLHILRHMAEVPTSVEDSVQRRWWSVGPWRAGAGLQAVHKGRAGSRRALTGTSCAGHCRRSRSSTGVRYLLHTKGEQLPVVAQPPERSGLRLRLR